MKDIRKQQETILVISAGLLVFYYFTQVIWLVYVATALIIVSLFSSAAMYYIHLAWMKIAEVLGWVNSKLILGALFFLFISPIAFLFRIFQSKDSSFFKSPDSKSVYTERNHTYTAKDLENMW